MSRKLVAVDEAAVVADYEADVLVNRSAPATTSGSSGCTGSSTATRSRAANRTRRSCRNDCGNASSPTTAPASPRRRSPVATASATDPCRTSPPSTAFIRNRHRSRDELVELVVRWFVGDDTTNEERQTITRIGVHTRQPGLRSLERLAPAIADDVRRRLAEVLHGSRQGAATR